MEPTDWKAAAGAYEREVLSVFDRDREGQIRALIDRYGWRHRSAADLGCGTGKFLPLLCARFGSVHACDYSREMLECAGSHQKGFDKLTIELCDLRRRAPECAPVDFVLCVNTLLSPSVSHREKMWKNVATTARAGGRVALVVPALESALFARHRLVEWNLRSGISGKAALKEGFDYADPGVAEISRAGVMDAGGVQTKHYLKEEIESTGARFGLKLESCEKIEYPWSTEFHKAPRWMRGPFPWDWLALLTKS